MNYIVYVVLFVVIVVMIFQNYKLMKRSKHAKKYINCTDAVFDHKENALEMLNEYISNEDSIEFKNKGRVVKAFVEAETSDPKETIEHLELFDVIYTKNKFDKEKFDFNSDTFFWMLLLAARLYKKGYIESLNLLNEKENMYDDDIKDDVVVAFFHNMYDNFKGNRHNDFYVLLTEGDYSGYTYDKRLIGFYKYIAITMKAYNGLELSEDDTNDIKVFATKKAGKLLMSDLGILDKYLEKPEETKEVTEEKNEDEE